MVVRHKFNWNKFEFMFETSTIDTKARAKLIKILFKDSLFRKKEKKHPLNKARHITMYKRYEIYERDKYTCCHCKEKGMIKGGKALLSIDHIVPIKYGGSSDIENLQTLCLKCNIKKGSKIGYYGELTSIVQKLKLEDLEFVSKNEEKILKK